MASSPDNGARATPGTCQTGSRRSGRNGVSFHKSYDDWSFMVFPLPAHPAGDKLATPPVRPDIAYDSIVCISVSLPDLLPLPRSVACFQRVA